MKELIRMDFYRLRKSNILKICIAVIMLGTIGITCLFKTVFSFLDIEKIEAAGGDETELEALLEMDAYNFTLIGLSLAQILGIIICIFVAVYVAGEFQQRTINLAVLKGYKRTHIYISKYINTILGAVIIYMCSFLFIFVTAGICFGFDFNIEGSLGRFIFVIFMDLLLYVGLASVFVMLSFFTCHEGITMTIGTIVLVLLTTGFSVIDSSINGNGSIPFENEVRSGKYWLATIIEDFSYLEIKNNEAVMAVVVAIIYIVITGIIGNLCFKRKDLK